MTVATITAVFTLAGVLATVVVNQHLTRQDRLRKDFAEALAAVERYAELPYRVRRRQGSAPETRERLSDIIHSVQQDLLFHQSWVRIQDPCVADAYDALVAAIKAEAGSAMSEAWRTAAIATDEDMPLGDGYDFSRMRQNRAEYVGVVRRQLEWAPARWVRERMLPWAIRVLERQRSDTR